jgi:hypothetical protein
MGAVAIMPFVIRRKLFRPNEAHSFIYGSICGGPVLPGNFEANLT